VKGRVHETSPTGYLGGALRLARCSIYVWAPLLDGGIRYFEIVQRAGYDYKTFKESCGAIHPA
jgi:hypothetical protein